MTEAKKKKQNGKTNKELRAAAKHLAKATPKNKMKKSPGITSSPLGKMRPRQERKAMAKSLKIPFNPQYNGPVYKYVPVEDAEGNLTIQLVEVN